MTDRTGSVPPVLGIAVVAGAVAPTLCVTVVRGPVNLTAFCSRFPIIDAGTVPSASITT